MKHFVALTLLAFSAGSFAAAASAPVAKPTTGPGPSASMPAMPASSASAPMMKKSKVTKTDTMKHKEVGK